MPDETRGESQPGYEYLVVVAYDDLMAGRQAVELVLRLNQHFPALRFEVRPWRFDLLSQPACQNSAVADGTEAELLIVSSRGGADLPEGVETWLTRTLSRKPGDTGAVVAMLGTEGRRDGPASPALRFIERATKAAGFDFFGPPLGDEGATGTGFSPGPAAPLAAPRAQQEFQPGLPFRGWGIND